MPPIKTTTPPVTPVAKPAAKKVAPRKPAPKKVMTPPPPMQSTGPLHKHTGFIVAIVIAVLLLVGASVVAYITWSSGEDLKSQIVSLNTNAKQIAQERDIANNDLEQARQDLENAPKPSPFFYATYAPAEGGEMSTTLHSLTSEKDTEIFTSAGPGSTTHSVFATPRVGFDGRVWLSETSGTDNVSIQLREFDSVAGTELIPTLFSDFLPVPDAMSLSPDETRIVAAYGPTNIIRPDLAGQVVVWNLLTGDMTSIGTLEEGEHFGDIYFSEYYGSDINLYDVMWRDNNCARSSIYKETPVEGEEGVVTRQYSGSREFCME